MKNTIRYYLKAYKQPEMNMTLVTRKPEKMTMAMSMNGLLLATLFIGSLLAFVLKRDLAFDGFLLTEQPYLLQMIYVIPLILVLWVMQSGLLYLLAISGKSASRRFFFDDALIVTSFAMVLSWLPFVGIPRIVLAATGFQIDVLYQVIITVIAPFILQTVYLSIGTKSIYKNSVVKSILVSLLSNLCFFAFVLIFLR